MKKFIPSLYVDAKPIDVVVQFYGKPYQTELSIYTLLEKNNQPINKIYLIEERDQPAGFDFSEHLKNIKKYAEKYDVLIEHFVPAHHYTFTGRKNIKSWESILTSSTQRQSIVYQYALEHSKNKFVMIIHNDVFFKENIVDSFLLYIDDHFCIGPIGQCWNCPFNKDKLCNGEDLYKYVKKHKTLTNLEIEESISKHQNTRTYKYFKHNPTSIPSFPMPECRVNEWCCMLNMDYYRKEVIPNGSVYPLGYSTIDTGDRWFKEMIEKGYTFRNYPTDAACLHSQNPAKVVRGGGWGALTDKTRYDAEETNAKKILEQLTK